MERIGEYLIRRLIGEGGMGKVYEAEERLSHRKVALKVLRPELSCSEQGREMFVSEMTILAHLDHPNIVRCLSCSEVDGELVMALEFLEGQTVRQRLLESGRLPWQEAVDIAVHVAAALRAANGQEPPIIHRDLKPENLMLVAGERVKVMDFGIAKVLQAMGKNTTHSVGTLQYMSPEQIDAAGVDARSDIYSLGLVLYEMLAGAAPFASESPRELLNLQCTQEPPPLPEDVRESLPRGVERLMLQMLEKSPDARPASAEDVIARFEPFAVASPPTGTKAGAKAPAAPARAEKPAAGPASANPTHPRSAESSDTIALIERASEPRRISSPLAAVLVLILCILAGATTYVIRVNTGEAPPAVETAAETSAVEAGARR